MDKLGIEWNWESLYLTELLIAYVLTLPIAWDREQTTRSAGLRTFPLVAIASCSYLLIARDVFEPEGLARAYYGLITGIGFIGGGAILKEGGSVKGTATAASIWSTGALGAAVALQHYGIAVVLSLMVFFTLRYVNTFKKIIKKENCDAENKD